MKIFLTSSRNGFNIPGIHVHFKKGGVVIYPSWIWSPKNRKYGFFQFWG